MPKKDDTAVNEFLGFSSKESFYFHLKKMLQRNVVKLNIIIWNKGYRKGNHLNQQ